ncbi:MAG: Lrp/AsnC family transcriptional regulator [Desulfovibrio sp.]|uniref:Lrp/AsnC family transcriptional regulator n=1 Tax=Desulfovibrio sp. 7SRBS1 TaxID=3378064 RepID=UPI003B3F7E48
MIDEIDTKILNILHENARISNAEIARRVAMAPSAVLERIRKMERKGVILGYDVRVDPRAVGLTLTAFTKVHTRDAVGSLEAGRAMASIPGVVEVHYTAGDAAFLVKSRVADTAALSELLRQIGQVASVHDTNSTIVLKSIKESAAYSVGLANE